MVAATGKAFVAVADAALVAATGTAFVDAVARAALVGSAAMADDDINAEARNARRAGFMCEK